MEKTFALVLPSACAAGRASAVELELERTLDFTIVERRYARMSSTCAATRPLPPLRVSVWSGCGRPT